MKSIIILSCVSAIMVIQGCLSALTMQTKVLKETETTAVIQGIGGSQFEAKDMAAQKATEMFGSYKETKPPECTQESRQHGRTVGTGTNQSYAVSGGTYHSCIFYFQKQ